VNDMKVAPARADMAANKASTSEVNGTPFRRRASHRSRCPRATNDRCELMLRSVPDDHIWQSSFRC